MVDAEGPFGLITMCSRIAVRQFSQQDLDLLVTIATAAGLRVRNVALADELAARRMLEHELQVAHDVQMSMLPRRDAGGTEVLDVAAALKPAHSVGGDLYDLFIAGDRLWFIVGDVGRQEHSPPRCTWPSRARCSAPWPPLPPASWTWRSG